MLERFLWIVADESYFTILNVTNPTSVAKLSSTQIVTNVFCCTTVAIALSADESICFVQLSSVLQSFNVTNPKSPSKLFEYVGISNYVHDMVLSKNNIFQIDQSEGINMVNVVNPANLTNASTALFQPFSTATYYGGRLDSTGAYLYVASRFQPRLIVVDVSNAPLSISAVTSLYQPTGFNLEREGICVDKKNGSMIATVGYESVLTLFDTRNVSYPVFAGQSNDSGNYFSDFATRCELRVGSGKAYVPNQKTKFLQIFGLTCSITQPSSTTMSSSTSSSTTSGSSTSGSSTSGSSTTASSTTTSTGTSSSNTNNTGTNSGSIITYTVLLLALITLFI